MTYKLRSPKWREFFPLTKLMFMAFSNRYKGLSLFSLRFETPFYFIGHMLFGRKGFIVAEHIPTGKVAGTICVQILLPRKASMIYFIAVFPDFRRMGLGSMLHEEAHRRLRELGFKKVRLQVLYENTPALNTALKFGGYIVGDVKMEYDIPGEDTLRIR